MIHGKVYEQTEKLLLTFDEIDVSDENMFREVLYFKSQISESKFGFTIAGLVPLKKITLLSILIIILFNRLLNFQLKNFSIQIFCFILNYTVILVQNGKV